MSTVGHHIRFARLHAKLTQFQLGARCGIRQPYLSAIERGIHEPGFAMVCRIAKALKLLRRDLLTGLDDNERDDDET